MLEQWGTSMHLMKVCRMSKSAVVNNLAKLYSDKRAHIADWNGSGQAPIWVKGPGENAPKRTATLDAKTEKHRKAVKASREMAKHYEAQIGRGREVSCNTIEKARTAGPRSPFAHLFDLAGDKS